MPQPFNPTSNSGTHYTFTLPRRTKNLAGNRVVVIHEWEKALAAIRRTYRLTAPSLIESYLESRKYLINPLIEGLAVAQHLAGAEPVELELHRDCEEGDSSLFIVGRADLPWEEAQELERRFRYDWLYKQSPVIQTAISFVIE